MTHQMSSSYKSRHAGLVASLPRHCEERSDEAIQHGLFAIASGSGLLRFARNDECSRSHSAIFASRCELKSLDSVFHRSGVLFASLRHCQQREEQERRQNADRRVTNCCTCRRSARSAGALACRRSTAALARETAGPQGSASGHASGDSPERSILYGRPNRGAEILRFAMHDPEKWMPVFRQDHAPLAGITRAGTTNERLSPYSEHLTRRS